VCVARNFHDALQALNRRVLHHVRAHRFQDVDIFTHRIQGVERELLLPGDLKKTRLLVARRNQQRAGETVQGGGLVVQDPECRGFPAALTFSSLKLVSGSITCARSRSALTIVQLRVHEVYG